MLQGDDDRKPLRMKNLPALPEWAAGAHSFELILLIPIQHCHLLFEDLQARFGLSLWAIPDIRTSRDTRQ